ncbi:MAG: DUF3089 domain-containing protein [Sphingomicrobium sp.]
MRIQLLGLSVALCAAGPAPLAAQPSPAPSGVDYTKDSNWLCLPNRKDICAVPLATTELPASGYGARTVAAPATNPPVDCFYIYPTVSRDSGLNSDLTPSDSEEAFAAQNQLSRFGSVCRTFAPMYRQMTVGAIAYAATGGDLTPIRHLAFADVSAAWHQFLRSRNANRPFVLIGHSQGSMMLGYLLGREIEGRPEAKRMLLAIIPGYNVLVPQQKLGGGTFKSTPLCSRAGQTHCVLSWESYRVANSPPEGALFGYADQPGMTVGCTNPASPGSTGWTRLDSYWNGRSSVSVPGGPIAWSSQGAPPTTFLHTTDLVSARCVNDGPRGYLSIRTNSIPGQRRTARIGGEVGMFGFFLPGWGMHLNDIAEAQGDLIKRISDVSAGLPRESTPR